MIHDQGADIDEVWLVIRRPTGIGTTKVFQRTSPFGEALLELALAQ